MGSSESKPEDPACQLAKKYRFPKKTGENIKVHFKALDIDSKGFLTKDDFDPLINKLNPISQNVLDAFFYPPDALDPEAEPLDSIDLEHCFKVTYMFLLFPTNRSCKEFRDIVITKPIQLFKDSEDKKHKRLIMLFLLFMMKMLSTRQLLQTLLRFSRLPERQMSQLRRLSVRLKRFLRKLSWTLVLSRKSAPNIR